MNEKQYYLVVVKVATENAKGKIRYRRDKYVVNAISASDVEKKVTDYLETLDGEIVQITAANIIDVIN